MILVLDFPWGSAGDGVIGIEEFTKVNAKGNVTAAHCAVAFQRLTDVSSPHSLELGFRRLYG